ncbi:uncharacterized protein FA14DRAFT_152978 [Meira miltonrushii]|uniref:Uncharacterized protein n=1 Tax=Meira miltonrushii TaxID=1280837 RepID=A0A316VMI1_9BASI|nr:uncharacterized protein FA14DRAFT_152978 [Meira miltonrushii]PWN37613.1 hypothetical protein FA14DRAFT_152978 [Meira miltonrushii]
MKSMFAIILLFCVYLPDTARGGDAELPLGSSPIRPNEAVNPHGRLIESIDQDHSIALVGGEESSKKRRLTEYQRRKQNKVAKLEKVGVDENVAKIVVNQNFSRIHRKWMKENKEKGKKLNRESYYRRYNIIKDKLNERRKERYRERKATEPNFAESRRMTKQDRYEANIRANLKKGMTQTEATEKANIYMETYRMKCRQSNQKHRQDKKQKAARQAPNQDQA